MSKILVVDDEQSMRDFLAIMLKKEGHEVVTAEEWRRRAQGGPGRDLRSGDHRREDAGNRRYEVLKTVKEISPETVVIMITAFATAETAVEAMKLGAYDYIIKPFKVDELKLIIYNSLEKRYLRKENILLKREIESKAGFREFHRQKRTDAEGIFSYQAGCGHDEHRADNRRERNRKRTCGEGHIHLTARERTGLS